MKKFKKAMASAKAEIMVGGLAVIWGATQMASLAAVKFSGGLV